MGRPLGIMRAIGVATLLIAGPLIGTTGVGAGSAGAPSLVLDPQAAAPGDAVRAAGRGHPQAADMWLVLNGPRGARLAEFVTAADGTFETTFTVPNETVPGPYDVWSCRPGRSSCVALASADLRVIEPPPPSEPPEEDPPDESPPPEEDPPPEDTPTDEPSPREPPSDEEPPDEEPPDEERPTREPPPGDDEVAVLPTPKPTSPDDLTTTDDPVCCDPTAPSGPDQIQQVPDQTQPPKINSEGGDDADENVDLFIRAIEVTQGIQDFESRMPLVAERRTWIRVHPRAVPVAVEVDVVGGAVLLQRGDGTERIIYPRNLSAQIAHGMDRTHPDSALNFLVPEEFTADGDLHIRALIWDTHPSSIDDDPNPDNNLLTTDVTFQDGTEPVVYVTPLDDGAGPGPPATAALGMDGLVALYEGLLNFHPIADAVPILLPDPVEPSPLAATPGQWDLTTSAGRSEPLIMLFWVHVAMDLSVDHRLFGVFDDFIPADGYNGWASSDLRSTWIKPYASTAAHEGGHLVGLAHVDCIGSEEEGGALDPTHPNAAPDCSLAPIDQSGYFGFTVMDDDPKVFSNNPGHPESAFPLMSYGSPKWSDPYHYCRMFEDYGMDCSPGAIGVPGIEYPEPHGHADCSPEVVDGVHLELCLDDPTAPDLDALDDVPLEDIHLLVPDAPDEWLLVTGQLDMDSQAVVGLRATTMPDLPATARSVYDYHLTSVRHGVYSGGTNEIRLRDSTGAAEVVVPFDLGLHTGHGPNGTGGDEPPDSGLLPLAQILPASEDVSRLEIVVGGWDETVTFPIAETAPQAPVVDVGSWSTADGLSVSWDTSMRLPADVLWSADGDQWYPVVLGTLRNSVDIPPDAGFPGGDVRIKVAVNEGGRRAETVSDPVAVPDNPPRARISGIADGEIARRHDVVDLRSVSQDPEDGMLDGDSVVWSSDRDGELGTGRHVVADGLSPGSHEITLTATDSAGEIAIESISITIEDDGSAAPLEQGAMPEVEDRLRANAATLPSDDMNGWLVFGGAVAVALIGTAVAGTLRHRRRKGTAG